jgi:predicted GNAT family acetyltransferase
VKTPTIRILKAGDEAVLEAFLVPQIETSMFLIGNQRLAGLVDNGERYQGTYAAIFQAGRITGVVAHYWNQNLVLQAAVADLLVLVAKAVEGSGRPVRGLIGPSDQVEVVKQALAIDASNVQMDETEKLYSLALDELVVPVSLASGRVKGRRIEAGDLDLLAEWEAGYAIEAIGEIDSPELRQRCREQTERAIREQQTWVLEEAGRPVARSAFNTVIAEAVQVGGVWTPPELRSRGYGRAAVEASLLDARAEGVRTSILFTGEDNIPAQKAYEALGYRCIGDYRIVLLRSGIETIPR